MMEIYTIGNLGGGKTQSRTVYDPIGICPTLCSGMDHGNTVPYVIEVNEVDYRICRMVSRDKDNPKYRGATNDNFEQILEPNYLGICNTLTSVQKDNLVMESIKLGNAANSNQRCAVYDENGLCPTIQASCGTGGNQQPMWVEIKYSESELDELSEWIWEINESFYLIRIRKLTPRECWALMDFNDGAFDLAKEVNSSTQLYKQAGNSIVVNVLVAVMGQLFEGYEEKYKEVG